MVGTLNEALDLKRDKKQIEEISSSEFRRLPKGLRIDIPLKSTHHWKRIAPLLRQYADQIETELRRKELMPVEQLSNIHFRGHTLRDCIDEICGVTRKTK